MKVSLAEHYHTLQGEGHYSGTPMHFLRLAGCSVGRPHLSEKSPILPTGNKAWECHRFDGQPFWCDTDFSRGEEVDHLSLLAQTWESHLCLTGGEPLNHPKVLRALLQTIREDHLDMMVHIETSGTIPYDFLHTKVVWITCSPKQGCLPESILQADEIKLLVDETPFSELPTEVLDHNRVFLSPINYAGGGINVKSLKIAMDLLHQYPDWRLSTQNHKWWGVR